MAPVYQRQGIAPATLFETGSLAGQVIVPGGVDIEVGTLQATGDFVTSLTKAAQSETDLYEPPVGAGGTFAPTDSLMEARYGQGLGIAGAGSDATDALVVGGACTSSPPLTLQSFPLGR